LSPITRRPRKFKVRSQDTPRVIRKRA
jgi:hypothetical protein